MTGNIRLTCVTYPQFCRRLRATMKRGIEPTRDDLYAEWCNTINRFGSIDYERHAKRIEKRHKRRRKAR